MERQRWRDRCRDARMGTMEVEAVGQEYLEKMKQDVLGIGRRDTVSARHDCPRPDSSSPALRPPHVPLFETHMLAAAAGLARCPLPAALAHSWGAPYSASRVPKDLRPPVMRPGRGHDARPGKPGLAIHGGGVKSEVHVRRILCVGCQRALFACQEEASQAGIGYLALCGLESGASF